MATLDSEKKDEYGDAAIIEKWARLTNIADKYVSNQSQGKKMDSLGSIAVFVQVAASGSFSATARQLGLSSSAVGKSVARMEARLGARLFRRSTRHLSLTAEGEQFLVRCRRILAEVEAAEQELSASSKGPSGRLRISLPRFSGLFHEVMLSFMRAYPDVELDLDFSDGLVNVISDGFDAVVRTGALEDSGLTRRRLCGFRRLLVAAPSYLDLHGRPALPSELAKHVCLHYRFPATGRLERWPLAADEVLSVNGLVCNSVEMRVFLAVQGAGIAYLPAFTVERELAAGQLLRVLDKYTQEEASFWLLWPSSSHLPSRLRVFIDFLVERLGDAAVVKNGGPETRT